VIAPFELSLLAFYTPIGRIDAIVQTVTRSVGTIGRTCDGVVMGIQGRALAGDIAAYRIITSIKPLGLQPVLVNRAENLRVSGL
jgi:hypothetical protein